MKGIERVRQRRLTLRGIEVVVVMPERNAEWIARSGVYRNLKPAARWLHRTLQPQHRPQRRREQPYVRDLSSGGFVDPIELQRRVEEVEWYHVLDLPGGVETPGIVDHRSQVHFYGLPESLDGMRCLDLATFDGFWAFEMEKLGAEEVVAFDIERWGDADLPRLLAENELSERCAQRTGDGFRIASEALGSHVKRVTGTIYELSPERHGYFDLVFISDLLLHLRDPAGALEAAFSVCKGQVLVADVYNPGLDDGADDCLTQFVARVPDVYQTWWLPSVNTLRMMMTVAGFEPIDELARFSLASRLDFEVRKVVLRGNVPKLQSWKRKRLERRLKLGPVQLAISAPRRLHTFHHAEIAPVGRRAPGFTRQNHDPANLEDRIATTGWYHTMDLGSGVVTPGLVDHRSQVGLYQIPDSLAGLRCLDVATLDGFWAFEMERRGAAEVVATDLPSFADLDWPRVMRGDVMHLNDMPTGAGFEIAKRAFQSRVMRKTESVYELNPTSLGRFDLVVLSDLLLHLRDPQRALEAVRSVCSGLLILAEVYNDQLAEGETCLSQFFLRVPHRPYTWWQPSVSTLKAMLAVAGFEPVTEVARFRIAIKVDYPVNQVVLHANVPERPSWRTGEKIQSGIRPAVRS